MNNRYLSLIIALVLSLNSFATNIETDRQWYLAGEAMKVSITTENAFMAYAELCDMHSIYPDLFRDIAPGTVFPVFNGIAQLVDKF